MNRKFDSIKRTRVLLNLALDHFHQSERFENSGDLEDARYERATAKEYRDMYRFREESETRATRDCWPVIAALRSVENIWPIKQS